MKNKMDTVLTVWKGKEKTFVVHHSGQSAAAIEIDACKSRIRKGEITHYTIEAISKHGCTYIDELRSR